MFAAFSWLLGASAVAAAVYTSSSTRALVTPAASPGQSRQSGEVVPVAKPAAAALEGERFDGPITTTRSKQAPRPATAIPSVTCVPQWRELIQGPSGRRVLETCGTNPVKLPTVDGSPRSTRLQRLKLPERPHASLLATGRELRPRASELVIGSSKLPDAT
jgi:hypothetical protein